MAAALPTSEVRSPTSTRTEVRSPTRTSTEVRSPTRTSTEAYTQGNFTSTVTGGAGAGATNVTIYATPLPAEQLGAPMKTMILHKIAFQFDRARNGLVFQGVLEDGFQFEVVFPIGHVAMVFDGEASRLGYIGRPMLGSVETVDGFLESVEIMNSDVPELGWFGSKLVKSIGKAASSVGKFAYQNTVKKVADQAIAVARAGVSIAKGGNVLKAVGGVVKSSTGDLKIAAQYAGTVPGIGTAVGALASGANAALNGKSLTEIAKATAVGAIPGGPLAQAAASAALNVTQRGIEGHNMVKAAASEVVNAAISMAPPATQNLIRQTATAAINGNNILTAAQHAAIQTAIAQIPDEHARNMVAQLATGKASATSLVSAAGGALTGRVVGSNANGAMSRLLNAAATVAPSTPHFVAISASGLAAAHVGHVGAKLASAPPTAANIAALQKFRANLEATAASGHPHASLIFAGLRAAPLKAA